MSPNALRLAKGLSKTAYGTLVTFGDLSVLAGADVSVRRSLISSAKRILARHHDRTLRSVRGVGYRVSRPGIGPCTHLMPVCVRKPASGHIILDVAPIDDPDGDRSGDRKALVVFYRELDGRIEEDRAVMRCGSPDTAVVEYLLGRLVPDQG